MEQKLQNNDLSGNKVAVFFHYFEGCDNYKDNFIYFLTVAYDPNLDFYIVIAGNSTLQLPDLPNIYTTHTANKNNDFGGYAEALSKLQLKQKYYDTYIFINSSVRGPFLPPFYEGSWAQLFTSRLKGDTHLVGSSINILLNSAPISATFSAKFSESQYPKPLSHVQTTAYALSHEAMEHLRSIGFYDEQETLEKRDVICLYELLLSQEIKRNGWNMSCFLPPYDRIDYRLPHQNPNFTVANGDPCKRGAYFGRSVLPSEVVFIKSNRQLLTEAELASHTYIALTHSDSPLTNWGATTGLIKRSRQLIESEFERTQLANKPSRHELMVEQLKKNLVGLRKNFRKPDKKSAL